MSWFYVFKFQLTNNRNNVVVNVHFIIAVGAVFNLIFFISFEPYGSPFANRFYFFNPNFCRLLKPLFMFGFCAGLCFIIKGFWDWLLIFVVTDNNPVLPAPI